MLWVVVKYFKRIFNLLVLGTFIAISVEEFISTIAAGVSSEVDSSTVGCIIKQILEDVFKCFVYEGVLRR